jgi:membrane-associated phospholipid phosphatase
VDAPLGASSEAAAVSAGYWTLVFLYPSQDALFDAAFDRYLADTPATTNRSDGLVVGADTAFMMLGWRDSDGSGTTVPYIPLFEPGEWQRTPPAFRPPELPQWPYVTPFAMTNGSQLRPPGPPLLTSAEYTRDFNLVKTLGGINSATRTAEQTLIARFWSDFSFTVTPPGHWNQIAQNVATNRGNTLTQNARLFALLNIAMADAGIAAWDAKYAFNFWRPVTAIREASSDGNPDTEEDTTWTPLLNTPPFPEYTSGHSAFSAASATVLAGFYGTDALPFSIGSDTLPGVYRSFDSVSACADEVGMSRIYGGIHFMSANRDGKEAGGRIGAYVFNNFLLPIAALPFVQIESVEPNGCRLRVHGHIGAQCVVEASADLVHWQAVSTNRATVGGFTQVDSSFATHPIRFYRAREE